MFMFMFIFFHLALIGFDIAALPLLYLISYELDRIQDDLTYARVKQSYASAYH
jgi:hypothetical protein